MSLPARTARVAAAGLLAAALLGLYLHYGREHRHGSPASVERAVLERRVQGLRGLLADSGAGLVPFDGVLAVVDQEVVQGVLRSSMPYERVVAGRYRVRVATAEVQFEDGAALVRIEGRASFADRADEDTWADVTLAGTVDVVELDPESGTLRGAVRILAMDARRVDVMGVRSSLAEGLVEDLGRERLESFGELLSRIEVPVALEHEITLPEVGPDGGVRIERATLPLRAGVAGVRAFAGRLWVRIAVDVPENGAP